MNIISGRNATEAYEEALWTMRIGSQREESRNGPVRVLPEPAILQIKNPLQRVIGDVERNANHFFHVMETIWMLAGKSKVDWLLQFNKGYVKYAEEDGSVWGAYGHRWRWHFGADQILGVVEALRKDHTDRRAMLGMWNPTADLNNPKKDVPCNTHIYLRVSAGALDMTVCNRSNDLIWGMLGANVVHMTYLQELIAHGIGVKVGTYRVFTQNLHMYESTPNFDRLWCTTVSRDVYREATTYPLLQKNEGVKDLFRDCEEFVRHGPDVSLFRTNWIYSVAEPMFRAYLEKDTEKRLGHIGKIQAEDWRLACREWVGRKKYA